MRPSSVVDRLKVLEDGVCQLKPCVSGFTVEEFNLHARPERFHVAVVVTIVD